MTFDTRHDRNMLHSKYRAPRHRATALSSRWGQILCYVCGLLLLLPPPVSAQSKLKAKDLTGDWYLDFKFSEVTPQGTKETSLLFYGKKNYSRGEGYGYDIVADLITDPVRLTLSEDGRAELFYKYTIEFKLLASGKLISHELFVKRNVIPLKWQLTQGQRLHFTLGDTHEWRCTNEYVPVIAPTTDEQADAAMGLEEGIENLVRGDALANLVENLNQMQIEYFTPTLFVLNGRRSYRPLRGAYQDALGEIQGWRANMVYAKRVSDDG